MGEINGDARGTCNTKTQIKFKTKLKVMLLQSVIVVKGTITTTGTGLYRLQAKQMREINK